MTTTGTDRQRDILTVLATGRDQVTASAAYPAATLRAMERRGWITLERKAEVPLHGAAVWYTEATITDAGLALVHGENAR